MALPKLLRRKAGSQKVAAADRPTAQAEPAKDPKEKRRWPRTSECIPLEASTNASDPEAGWPVEAQEESPGGVAIRSNREVAVGSLLFVRAKPPYEPNAWMCGEVAHCTQVGDGFVIGLRMDHHIPPESSV